MYKNLKIETGSKNRTQMGICVVVLAPDLPLLISVQCGSQMLLLSGWRQGDVSRWMLGGWKCTLPSALRLRGLKTMIRQPRFGGSVT